MIVNNASLEALRVGFNASYMRAFNAATPLYAGLATTIPSSAKLNTYGWMGDFPTMRRWIGDRRIKSLGEKAYTLANEDFEATIGVAKNDIEDDTLGVYTPIIEGLGQSAKTYPDKLVFNVVADGFIQPCYDGQNFYDEEHPVGDGVVSNVTDGAGTPWFLLDCSRPLKPYIFQERQKPNFAAMTLPNDEAVFMRKEFRYGVDARGAAGYAFWQLAHASKAPLTADNYAAARAAMMAIKNDEGEPLAVKPTHLVVGGSNTAAAKQLIEAMTGPNGSSNIWYKDVAVLEAPRLA